VIDDLLAIVLSVQNRSTILQYAWVAADWKHGEDPVLRLA